MHLLIWILPLWFIPLVFSWAVTYVLIRLRVGVLLKPEDVSQITGPLIAFLGISIAILIAVFTSIYVQSRGKRESGFNAFHEAFSDFTELIRRFKNELDEVFCQKARVFYEWSCCLEFIMGKLREIKPAWGGYDSDPKLENHILGYVWQFERLIESLGTTALRSEYPTLHDRYIRGMLIGLLTMEEAIVGSLLSKRLTRILWSFSVLLVLSFFVLIASALKPEFEMAGFVNLLVIVGMSLVAIAHFLAVIVLIFRWQRDVQKRDKEWQSNNVRKRQYSTDAVKCRLSGSPILVLAALGAFACVVIKLWRLLGARFAPSSHENKSNRSEHKQ